MPNNSDQPRLTATLEYTLAIIKPDAIHRRIEILREIKRNGFYVISQKKIQISPEQAADFYESDEKTYEYMFKVFNLSNGTIEPMILAKENAICDFLKLLGPAKPSHARRQCPNSLRAKYGDCYDDFKNGLHGSIKDEVVIREIHFFFPNFVIDPINRFDSTNICCKKEIVETLLTGLVQVLKDKCEHVGLLGEWLLANNPSKPLISSAQDYLEARAKEKPKSKGVCTPNEPKPADEEATSSSSPSSSASILTSDRRSVPSTEITITSDSSRDFTCTCNVRSFPPSEGAICPTCGKVIHISLPVKKPLYSTTSSETSELISRSPCSSYTCDSSTTSTARISNGSCYSSPDEDQVQGEAVIECQFQKGENENTGAETTERFSKK